MNLGQALGEQKLRILQLEDELAARPPIEQRATSNEQRLRAGLPKQVVELLQASDRPLSSVEIGAALDCDLTALYQRIPPLLRRGLITRQGRRKHYAYSAPGRRASSPLVGED